VKKDPKDYIIFPLDLPDYDAAMPYVEKLASHVGLFKVGLELFISEGPPIIKAIQDTGPAEIFLDLKLHDIPATVQKAFSAASRHGVRFVTVHCDAGEEALRAAAKAGQGKTQILAVTVLTSLDTGALKNLGYEKNYTEDISRLVLLRAKMAKRAGCHGMVCSGRELAKIRGALGRDVVLVAPGIRPSWSIVDADDQKRIVTPENAIKAGADYLVIGRPIRNAPDPADAAKKVAEEIEKAITHAQK